MLKVLLLRHVWPYSGNTDLFPWVSTHRTSPWFSLLLTWKSNTWYRILMIKIASKKTFNGAFSLSYHSSHVCLFLCDSPGSCFLPKPLPLISAWEITTKKTAFCSRNSWSLLMLFHCFLALWLPSGWALTFETLALVTDLGDLHSSLKKSALFS